MIDSYRKDLERISRLTPWQYQVTQQKDTEPAFHSEFWDHKAAGIYVDIVSGEPLFTSTKKLDSGCGWPSFAAPLERANVVENEVRRHSMVRSEVRSLHGNSHLGRVFTDEPIREGGLRYCINSVPLRFVPYEDLESERYGQYEERLEGAVTETAVRADNPSLGHFEAATWPDAPSPRLRRPRTGRRPGARLLHRRQSEPRRSPLSSRLAADKRFADKFDHTADRNDRPRHPRA